MRIQLIAFDFKHLNSALELLICYFVNRNHYSTIIILMEKNKHQEQKIITFMQLILCTEYHIDLNLAL